MKHGKLHLNMRIHLLLLLCEHMAVTSPVTSHHKHRQFYWQSSQILRACSTTLSAFDPVNKTDHSSAVSKLSNCTYYEGRHLSLRGLLQIPAKTKINKFTSQSKKFSLYNIFSLSSYSDVQALIHKENFNHASFKNIAQMAGNRD